MDSLVPGVNNFTDLVNKRVLVWLRDGRKLYGLLRSYDQFGNVVLNDCYERYYLDLEYAEEYRGVYLMRGENIVLVGELDPVEYPTVAKRMAKFRRSMEYLLPKYQERLQEISATRAALGANNEMAENDLY